MVLLQLNIRSLRTWAFSSYLLSMSVAPGDPASAVSTVVDLVHGRKLDAMTPCMASLGPHESDKVQGT